MVGSDISARMGATVICRGDSARCPFFVRLRQQPIRHCPIRQSGNGQCHGVAVLGTDTNTLSIFIRRIDRRGGLYRIYEMERYTREDRTLKEDLIKAGDCTEDAIQHIPQKLFKRA